ncbi:MAG: RHS repeat-associated core domain-containing protein [Bacteroidales bacterium]|nr:RHS repeat-associated core domain-containing protein [Bacteroidales bacterium]
MWIFFNTYSFSGQLIQSKNLLNNGPRGIISYTFDHAYDHDWRPIGTQLTYGGTTQQLNMKQYNEVGQLQNSFLHGSEAQHLHARNYTYNIRGWLTGINSLETSSTGAFAQKIYYNEVPSYMAGKATARYNGNIQAFEWRNQGITPSGFVSGYVFSYDKLNRLTKALFMKRNLGNGSVIWDQSVAASKYNYGLVTSVGTVRGINYDKNGNIKTLSRLARRSSDTDIVVFDSLTYTYDGNRLKNVSDAISGQNDLRDFPGGGFQGAENFFYDANGNMNSDNVRGIQLTYNHMNMPTTILSNEGHIENTYSWDGSKRRRRVLDQIEQQLSDERYFGDLVTENDLPSLILHADGYVDVSGMQPLFTYHLKDHLGNVRIVLQAGGSSGTLKQSNDYYPFGMAFTKNAVDSEEESFARENKYKYNGKEEQPMPGKWLDYGARFYDSQLGRWHSIDPLAEAFISFTPYHYVRNNPVKLYDINGMADNDWFERQREIDANYNAQNDAMFNSIMTGPALGKTQTVKNTDEKKKKNEGDGEKNKTQTGRKLYDEKGTPLPDETIKGLIWGWSIDFTLAIPGGWSFELGEIFDSNTGQTYQFVTSGPAFGFELSTSVNVIFIEPLRGFKITDIEGVSWGVNGGGIFYLSGSYGGNITPALFPKGVEFETYKLYKFGIGPGLGSSNTPASHTKFKNWIPKKLH